MQNDRWSIPLTVDLRHGAPQPRAVPQGLMLPGDSEAHTIVVTVVSGEEAAVLRGTPRGYFVRADGNTVVCAGTLEGNVARVTLDAACYAVPGPLRCLIRLEADEDEGASLSLVEAQFTVREGPGEALVDPGNAFPSLHAQAERLEAVEEGASTLSQRLNLAEARLTALASLPEGSTTADAELADIRVGADGTVYASAGEAVRGQVGALQEELDDTRARASEYYAYSESPQALGYDRILHGRFELGVILNNGGLNGSATGMRSADFIEISDADKARALVTLSGRYDAYRYAVAAYDAEKRFIALTGSKTADRQLSAVFGADNLAALRYIRLMVLRASGNARFTASELSTVAAIAKVYVGAYTLEGDVQTLTAATEALGGTAAALCDAALLAQSMEIDGAGIDDSGVIVAEAGWSTLALAVRPGSLVHRIRLSAASQQVVYAFYANAPALGSASCTGDRALTDPGVLEAAAVRVPPNARWLAIRHKAGDAPLVETFHAADFQDYAAAQQAAACVAMFEKIGCCGDSFTAGYLYDVPGVPRAAYPAVSWPASLGRLYGVKARAFAKPGATTASYLTDPAGLPAAEAAEPQQLYVIALGLNDHTQGIPVGSIADIHDDYNENPATFFGNYGRIIDRLRLHAPKAKFVLCKSFWVLRAGNHARYPYGVTGYYDYMSAPVEAIAAHYGIPWLETLDDPFFCSPEYADGLIGFHPTGPLYAAMAKRLGELIGAAILKNPDYFCDFNGTDE